MEIENEITIDGIVYCRKKILIDMNTIVYCNICGSQDKFGNGNASMIKINRYPTSIRTCMSCSRIYSNERI